MSKRIERILQGQKVVKHVFESDFHSGSVSALLPPNAWRVLEDNYSERVRQNRMQRWLWRNRLDDLSTIGKVDVYHFLGDSCEGQQLKIAGRTVTDTDTDNQVAWAIHDIQQALDIVKPKYFLGVNGTPYHVRTSGSLDRQVYRGLESQNKNIKFIYQDNLLLKIGELTYSLSHVYPTTQYKTPPLEKLINQHAVEHYLNNMPRIQVFVRGHAHIFVWSRYRGNIYAFIVPCQQPTSSFARSKAYLTVRRPDVGILAVEQRGRDLVPRPYLHKWGR